MIRFLKSVQLALSLGVAVVVSAIYPGVMALFAGVVGLAYTGVSVGAFQENRIFIWIAFAFSSAVAVLSVLSVNRFVQNDFDYRTGNFPHEADVNTLPYIVLTIAIVSSLVCVGHVISWRWMFGRQVEPTN